LFRDLFLQLCYEAKPLGPECQDYYERDEEGSENSTFKAMVNNPRSAVLTWLIAPFNGPRANFTYKKLRK